MQFLSTLSLRRATASGGAPSSCFGNFYPRSPCGERPVQNAQIHKQNDFYPRSPCGERHEPSPCRGHNNNFYPRSPCGERLLWVLRKVPILDFYPRSPCGERHLRVLDGSKSSIISIHALLAESDGQYIVSLISFGHFYPRSPCGERPKLLAISVFIHTFLSTLSLRRATKYHRADRVRAYISIHALLAESDKDRPRPSAGINNFYPRSPCGERLELFAKWLCYSLISIHALLAESDVSFMLYDTTALIFLSTLSLRRATPKIR